MPAGRRARRTVGNYPGHQWGPRAGAAYQLNSKTVLRGGYGIFYAPQISLGGPFAHLALPNTTEFTGRATADGADESIPDRAAAPVGSTLGASQVLAFSLISLVDPNAKAPIIQQYSVDVQRE